MALRSADCAFEINLLALKQIVLPEQNELHQLILLKSFAQALVLSGTVSRTFVAVQQTLYTMYFSPIGGISCPSYVSNVILKHIPA